MSVEQGNQLCMPWHCCHNNENGLSEISSWNPQDEGKRGRSVTPSRLTTRTLILRNPIQVCVLLTIDLGEDESVLTLSVSVWRWLQLVQNPEILRYGTFVVNLKVEIILDDIQLKGGGRGGEKAGSLQASSPCQTSSSCKNTVIIHQFNMHVSFTGNRRENVKLKLFADHHNSSVQSHRCLRSPASQ